jgi:hypothetical protein
MVFVAEKVCIAELFIVVRVIARADPALVRRMLPGALFLLCGLAGFAAELAPAALAIRRPCDKYSSALGVITTNLDFPAAQFNNMIFILLCLRIIEPLAETNCRCQLCAVVTALSEGKPAAPLYKLNQRSAPTNYSDAVLSPCDHHRRPPHNPDREDLDD